MTTHTTPSKLVLLVTLLTFVFLSAPAKTFTNYPSIGVRMNWAGNKLAAAPAFTIRYSFPKLDVDLGANFQLCGSRFTGLESTIMRYFAAPTRKVRLGIFAGVRYTYGASLNSSAVAQENWVQPESKLHFDELRLRCMEEQVGFGVRVYHTRHINTFYGVAVGAYQTLGETAQYKGMHRQPCQAQLSLNCALSYSFR